MSGVPITIPALPAVTLTDTDVVAVWDAESGIQGKANLAAVITYLQATFARMAAANVFTANQVIDKINPSLTMQGSGLGLVTIIDLDNGSASGGILNAGRNSNASTPAAGVLRIKNMAGNNATLWPDASSIWRTSSALPTNATDTSGTVVGSQTSSLDQKDVIGELSSIEEVLAFVAEGAAAVRKFQYKAGTFDIYDDEGNVIGQGQTPRPYNGEEFEGVIVDYAGRYGMDRDEAHPEGRSLNAVNATGDLLRAVAWLVEQNAALAARIEVLEAV